MTAQATATTTPLAVPSRISRAPVAWLALGVTAAAATVTAPIIARGAHDLLAEIVRAALALAWILAAQTILISRPTERQGFIALWGSLIGAAGTLAAAILRAHAHGTTIDPSVISAAEVIRPLAVALLPVVGMHLLLGLPDGTCLFSRTAVAVGYLVGAVVGLGLWTQRPDIALWPVGVEALIALPLGAIASHRRYRRAQGLERQRMQWVGWAVAVGLEVVLASVALRVLTGWPTRPLLVLGVATAPIPLALAFASSRRLAGRVDRLLAHSVSVAGLTGVVLSVYLVIVVGLGRTPTGHERTLLSLSLVASAVAALLYVPARQRLSQYSNRLVYGEREPPDTVLRTFGSRLSRAVPMDELLLQVAESLRKTLNLSSAEVWTGSGGRLVRTVSVPEAAATTLTLSREEESVVARSGVSGPAWVSVWLPSLRSGREEAILRVAPTTHSGRVLGLIVATRPWNGDQFTADDEAMLTELARQVGLALHNVELDSALQASLEEVRRKAEELQASRARIVAASDAARRQIERNLHDGAQQHLVALAVNVRLARKLAESDPAASLELLDQLGADLQDAVQELRALAHGIYPPLLVDRGLGEALRSAAGRAALPTTADTDGVDRYPPEVEAAVYFCCLEAMQNAGKHAGEGAVATVRVWQEEGGLLFEVHDTGAGFDPNGRQAKGAGFVNMADRVGAIGGSVDVRSALGQGTTISGRIPLS